MCVYIIHIYVIYIIIQIDIYIYLESQIISKTCLKYHIYIYIDIDIYETCTFVLVFIMWVSRSQALRFAGKHLHPLSHLTGPLHTFLALLVQPLHL